MSLIEQLLEARRARLIRMGAPSPYQAPLPRPQPPEVEGVPSRPKQKLRNVQEPHFREMWFGDLIWPSEPYAAASFENIKVKDLRDVVCLYFHLTPLDIKSSRRDVKASYPRQILYFLCRTLTSRSFPEIGRLIGDRDHTTIMHGFQKIDRLRLEDWRVAYDLAMVEKLL